MTPQAQLQSRTSGKHTALPYHTVLLALLLLIATACTTTQRSDSFPPEVKQNLLAQDELRVGHAAFREGAYDRAIPAFIGVTEQYPDTPFAEEARWMLARSYEADRQYDRALTEFKRFRASYPQNPNADEAVEKIKLLAEHVRAAPATLVKPAPEEYRIGKEDELSISVYGDKELVSTQSVRPDGRVAFPLLGELEAVGHTPENLRIRITDGLSKYLRNPRVTVVVTRFTNKPVFVLGEVKKPGLIRLNANGRLLEAISRAEGLTDLADLRGAVLIRDGEVVPVSFHKLLRQGDFTQNVVLMNDDAVFIPNAANKKVFVLGEVQRPTVIALRTDINLIEAIASAGGFTRDAVSDEVVILRGGLGDPKAIKVDPREITGKANSANNMTLQPNDIVFVPKTKLATVERYVELVTKLAQTAFFTEFSIALYPNVRDVFLGKDAPQPITVIQTPPVTR
ncbi:polysaccharide biosynthesis/export family protein [Candidatus Nitrospira bockiana]